MADMPNDFWSGWIVVITVLSLVALAWIVLSIFFSSGAKAAEQEDEKDEPVWDEDLREGHAPPPLWWFWFILAAMVFTVVYLMLYPGLGDYKGVLNWSQDSRVASSYEEFESRFQEERQKIAQHTVGELQDNPDYMTAAEGIFSRNCAVCHGPDAKGQADMFPDLMDNEWQWGGSTEAIEETIRHGRKANMMSWRNVLSGRKIDRVVNYVLALGTDGAQNHPGARVFAQNCASCHGSSGEGNPMMGAPDLSNDSWLYGGKPSQVKASIFHGRQGEMPAFEDRLDDTQIKLLVAWLTRDLTLEMSEAPH